METKENKMGVMPVKKLLINMSLPVMFSMLVQALYNIVDSIYVSRISEEALTAVTLAFPMQNLMIAFATGIGVGVNALLSKSLGEKNFDRADQAANTGLLLTFFNYLLFLLIGLLFASRFISSQTDVEEIRRHGSMYLMLVSTLSFGLFFQVMLERLLQSTGRTVLSMISQLTGAVVNIIFDPILIFGLFFFPKLGVAGAAYATVLGQVIAACVGLFLNRRKNPEIHLSMRLVLHPKMWVIGRIYKVGIPSVLMVAIGSVMTFLMNLILGTFNATAQAVFGAYFKLQSFFFMPVFGINSGLIPILAYNYGARRKDRIQEALKFAFVVGVSIMLIGTLIFELFPGALMGLFDASEEMLRIGVPAMRIIAIHFPLAGCCIILGSTFQAFSKSMYSLVISVCRQLVVLIPVAWLLSKTGNLGNVWFAFPIAEVTSLIVSSLFYRKLSGELIEKL